ncbi:hypothetical protein TcasGA2_TC009855 [Tribolium castaneum]|uniref:Uncharacterized protein n=1 Tax=Tribolium castaneum TaxID=7070 RepID=D6WQ14_TRICA|nr:hypothetical protein TcasGA2_TC009855 [Tribolium castaneum]
MFCLRVAFSIPEVIIILYIDKYRAATTRSTDKTAKPEEFFRGPCICLGLAANSSFFRLGGNFLRCEGSTGPHITHFAKDEENQRLLNRWRTKRSPMCKLSELNKSRMDCLTMRQILDCVGRSSFVMVGPGGLKKTFMLPIVKIVNYKSMRQRELTT